MCGTKYCLVPYLQSIVAAGSLLGHCAQPNDPGHGPLRRLTQKIAGKALTQSLSSSSAVRKAEKEIAEFRRFQTLVNEKAGFYIADHCDVMIAVWDGLSSQGRGGTADIVARAKERGKPICHIWAGNYKKDPEKRTDLEEKHGTVEFFNFGAYEPSADSAMVAA